MKSIDFNHFKNGTLFLIRTPDTFPEGYAQSTFEDMRGLHIDYAAWLETWNCADGVLWIHPDYPRSHFWEGCPRDPLEETFLAADSTGIAFLPECGVMHKSFIEANADAKLTSYEGQLGTYGRLGLVPSCPLTLDYFIAKYDAFIGKFGQHSSFGGICLPAENSVLLSYDRYTESAYRKAFGEPLPSPTQLHESEGLQKNVYGFLEEQFLNMFRRLAKHIRQKYNLPLMHYPLSKISALSHHEPNLLFPTSNLELIMKVEEIDLLNLQLHPPLGNHPRQFKLEIELTEAITDRPVVADTHWYHETNAGKLPELTPKRYVDWILASLTPWGISFFCYGFMADKLPLWSKELNPGARVFNCYATPTAVAARRNAVRLGMDFTEQLRPMLDGTRHVAETAIFYRESIDNDYRFGNYYREHLFSLYEQLQATAIPVTITSTIPTSNESVHCLIFDAVKSLPQEDAARLEQFLASGGYAIIIGNCCEAIYRACHISVRQCAAEYVAAPGGTFGEWFFSLPVDAIKWTAEGDSLYLYNTGQSAVVQRGHAIYIGCSAAVSDFDNQRQLGLVEMWRHLLNLCDAESGVRLLASYRGQPGAHEFVSSDIFQSLNGHRKLLLIRDFGVEVISSTLKWSLPDGWKVQRAIIDGRPITLSDDGTLPEFEYFVAIEAE